MAQQGEINAVKVFRVSTAALLLDGGLTIQTEAAKQTLALTKRFVQLLSNSNQLSKHAIFFIQNPC